MNKLIKDRLLSNEFGQATEQELLKEYTTMHIGGPADILVKPETDQQIADLFKLSKKNNIPLTVIGRGSNILIRDKGVRGIVMILRDNYSNIEVEDTIVTAQAGASLRDTAIKSFEHSLTGMEAVSGIPGSIGGAIIMNAGAYGTEMKDIVDSVKVLDTEGNILTLTNKDMDFAYRHSIAESKGYIVLQASYKLEKGIPEVIQKTFEEFDYKRSSRQPLDRYSAGSTFKRPEGYFASKLIDEAGLRGFTVDKAQVSEKHTGFLINIDDATCENMLELIRQVQEKILDIYDVQLEREVKLIGEE